MTAAPGMQVYKAEQPEWPVRVYNLLYEDSQEADKFSEAVAREVRRVLHYPPPAACLATTLTPLDLLKSVHEGSSEVLQAVTCHVHQTCIA